MKKYAVTLKLDVTYKISANNQREAIDKIIGGIEESEKGIWGKIKTSASELIGVGNKKGGWDLFNI